MRMVTIVGSKTYTGAEAKAVSLAASQSFRERQDRIDQLKALARRPRKGDTASVRFAMNAIEQRIVRGLWVLEISQAADGPREAARHGLDYMRERLDHFAAGEWQYGPSRPPVPSSKEIELAKEAHGWIKFLDEPQARLLNIAAQTKRGDRARRVNWGRVQDRIISLRDVPMRTLQDRYDQALRWIVAELTLQTAEK